MIVDRSTRPSRRTVLHLFALAVAGCGSPVQILRQSATESPGALPGFVVSPLDFKEFVMKGEPIDAWLATRTPEQKASFEKDKERLDETFRASLRKHASGFQLAWDDEEGEAPSGSLGRMTGRVLGEMHGVFSLMSPGGEVIDEVEVKYEVGWGEITSHMQMFGSLAGEHIGQHLQDRKG